MNITDLDINAIKGKIKEIDMEKRKVNYQRKVEDETRAGEAIAAAGKLYNCSLRPEIDVKTYKLTMQVESDPKIKNIKQAQKNMVDYGKYVAEVLHKFKVNFEMVAMVVEGKPKVVVILMVNW